MPFYNYQLDKKGIQALISDCHHLLGRDATLRLLDDLKALGFKASTKAGLSFGASDIRIPGSKGDILADTQKEIDKIEKAYHKGVITDGERYLKIIDLWTHAREELVGQDLMKVLADDFNEDDRLRQPDLLHGDVGRPWLGRPDPPAGRDARPDGQALGQDHRDAHQGELPRRPEACSSTSRRRTALVRAWPTRR